MGKYTVTAGQCIYDIALHLYGSIEGITDLLISNPALSLEDTLRSGQELVYSDDFEIDSDVASWARRPVRLSAPTARFFLRERMEKENDGTRSRTAVD